MKCSFNQVYFKHCAIQLKKSGTKIPRIELIEIGPSMDLVIRRHRLANDDLRKEAMKSTLKGTKKKVKFGFILGAKSYYRNEIWLLCINILKYAGQEC